jgi:uncharacterized protein (DUF1501 family)
MNLPAGCTGFRRSLAASRRHFLQTGCLGAVGLALPDLLRADHQQSAPSVPVSLPRPRAKACVLVYLFGGPPHLDTWDMKPNAPAEVRGEFRPAATKAPGLFFCELLPHLGQVAPLLTVVRSMTHERNVHGGAVGFVLTGTRTLDPGIPGVRGPDASVGDHPNLGAGVSRFQPVQIPVATAVTLPYTMIDGQGRFVPGQTAGMLGDRYNPWLIEQDPNAAGFRVEGLHLPADLPAHRLAGRQTLLSRLDDPRRAREESAAVGQLDTYYQRAFNLLTSSRTREAFRLDREPAKLRDRFGRNSFGQSCLLACRLIEAGVRFVQVNMGNVLLKDLTWDNHSNNFRRLRDPLLPIFDTGFPSLLECLRERGLLSETLVVVMSEFGRSPRVVGGGRDHWPRCYSTLLAGAGLTGGAVYGQSDKLAAYPAADPVTPEDLAATIYSALGVDPEAEIYDRQQRPLKLVQGAPLHRLWG